MNCFLIYFRERQTDSNKGFRGKVIKSESYFSPHLRRKVAHVMVVHLPRVTSTHIREGENHKPSETVVEEDKDAAKND
jgi:hypothetical protein